MTFPFALMNLSGVILTGQPPFPTQETRCRQTEVRGIRRRLAVIAGQARINATLRQSVDIPRVTKCAKAAD
jgi:hypothetical protein